MAENWDFYLASVDFQTASLFVDLGAIDRAPEPGRTHLVRVSLTLATRRDDGLCEPEESETLNAMEDALFNAVARGLRARYVGRVTSQGRREFFYYGPPELDYAAAVAQAAASFPDYALVTRVSDEPDWKTYREVLYPDALDRQSIETRRSVEQLAEAGDDPNEPRDIDHFVAFPSEESRDQFLLQVAGSGFRSEGLPAAADDARPVYRVRLTRRDRIELEFIDGLVTDLFLRARNCGGTYEHWDAPIVRR